MFNGAHTTRSPLNPAMYAGNAEQQDTGFWDVVYILYADLAEAAGVAVLRGLIPHWGLMEKTLMVRHF